MKNLVFLILFGVLLVSCSNSTGPDNLTTVNKAYALPKQDATQIGQKWTLINYTFMAYTPKDSLYASAVHTADSVRLKWGTEKSVKITGDTFYSYVLETADSTRYIDTSVILVSDTMASCSTSVNVWGQRYYSEIVGSRDTLFVMTRTHTYSDPNYTQVYVTKWKAMTGFFPPDDWQ